MANNLDASIGNLGMNNIINRKPNIIKVQGGFPSLSATFILNQIIGLIDRGVNIHNWATYDTKQSVIHKQIKEYGLLETVTYLKFPHPHLKNNTSTWLSEFCRMNKVPDLQSIDAFHVHYGAIFNQLEPLFRIYQGFVMVSFHGYDASRYFVEHGDNCYNYLFQRADVITTVTHAMKHELVIRGCNPDKIRVHRSGLNPALFRKGSKNTDKVVLLTVARLEEKKGIKYSIEAFANCKNKQNAEYRIIGEGSLRGELEALINKLGVSDKVLLLGAKDKDDVTTEMSHADIFVLTCVTAANGDREGLPGVLMEAHASSLPVISTYHAGIPELVENGKTGFLVQERDIEATTQAMELLISDKALRNQLSSMSLDRVKYEFDIERLNDKLAQVIQDGILSTTEHVLFRQLSNINWQHKLSLYQPIFEKAEQLKEINNPKLSVIVISWRLHQDNLINFQILEQQRKHNFELIFVDNGAAEGEFDCLKPYIDTYVKLNTNTGAYLARNVGAAFAKAPILLFLEDDGIPESNLIEAHLKAHQTYDVIAVRGVYHPKTNNPLNQIARHYYHGPKPFPLAGDLEGNSSYLAETFFKVGGWDDEILFGHGGVELAIRLSKLEPDFRKQIYSPEPIIYHDYVKDEQHLNTKRARQNESLNRLKIKHPDWDSELAKWYSYLEHHDKLIRIKHLDYKTSVPNPSHESQHKAYHEFAYWSQRKQQEGVLTNSHYEKFYTEFFGLDKSFYDGKRILDIGCGPRGSLEWADNALERVGLDPLADAYKTLNEGRHAMQYVAAPSERIPFQDGYFDVVCSFNSIDHVDDLDKTILEIKRVLAPGGIFLLMTDVNHKPTDCEPICFSWDVTDKFSPQFSMVGRRCFEKNPKGIYASCTSPYNFNDLSDRYGVLAAKFIKNGQTESTPLITIAIPTYNRANYLSDAINSALIQNASSYEIVIVDDGSTDNTGELVKSFNDPRIRYVLKEHSGAPATRNRCITEAKGKYILWLDSDDKLMPDAVSRYTNAINAMPEVDVFYGDLIVTDTHFNHKQDLKYPDWLGRNKELLARLFVANAIPNPGTLVKKGCYQHFGGYDESFRRAHDYELWIRLAKVAKFKHIGSVVVLWRWHDGNMSSGSVNFDKSFDARIVRNMLERFDLKELFPLIEWDKLPQERAEALACIEIANRFMTLEDVSGALLYARKAVELFPHEKMREYLCMVEKHVVGFDKEHVSESNATQELSPATEKNAKVLLIAHNFVTHWLGGVEVYTYNFAKTLLAAGVKVEVLYPVKRDGVDTPFIETDSYDGITIHRFVNNYKDATYQLTRAYDADFTDFLRQQSFDVVHFHHILGLPFSFIDIAHQSGSVVCITLHDFWFICANYHLYNPKNNSVCNGPLSYEACANCLLGNEDAGENCNMLAKWLKLRNSTALASLQKADCIVSPSRYLADIYMRFGVTQPIEVSPLGLMPIRKSRRRTMDSVVFGFLGSIQDVKNSLLLAEAFKEVTGTARLLFFGNGVPANIDKLLISIAEDRRIAYLGAYKPEQLADVLGQIDVVVAPSVMENYPLVIREALSAGVPVIASRVGGIPEILTHLHNGIMFDPYNKNELRGWLQAICDNPALISELKRNISPVKTMEEDVAEWLVRYNRLNNSFCIDDSLTALMQKSMIDDGKTNLLILSFQHPEDACARIRLIDPLSVTGKFNITWAADARTHPDLFNKQFEEADIILVQRFYPSPATYNTLDFILNSGKPVIYDTDDLLLKLQDNQFQKPLNQSEISTLNNLLPRFTAISVSTKLLKEEYRAYNKNIHIMPNSINTNLFSRLPVQQSAQMPITIAIAGTNTHIDDVAMIDTTLFKLAEEYGNQLSFLFIGYASRYHTSLPGFRFVDFEAEYCKYAANLSSIKIDIALTPLIDNKFNRCKSNIKWLEYSACGIAGVYSDLYPYSDCIDHGKTGLLVGYDPEQWYQAIKLLIETPQLRKSMSEAAYKEVVSCYGMDKAAARMDEFLSLYLRV